jgi:hypothetical protein
MALFAFVAFRFGTLILNSPGTIKAVLHLSFWADCIVGVSFGRFPNQTSDRFGWVIAAIIYVYLLRSVTRIANELKGELSDPAQDPTFAPVTPPAEPGAAANH